MNYLFLLLTISLAYWLVYVIYVTMRKLVFSPIQERIIESVPPLPHRISFFGGPFDGFADLTSESNAFLIAPYQKMMNSHMPNFAYYRQMTDTDYFYVRDISQSELMSLNQYGIEPSVEPEPSEED